MNHDQVRALEQACEKALAEALEKSGVAEPSPRTCHLMAKAAVAVLEAVEEERRVRK